MKVGLKAVNGAGEVVDLSELTKWELDSYLRRVADEDGQDMLIHHVWPIMKALKEKS